MSQLFFFQTFFLLLITLKLSHTSIFSSYEIRDLEGDQTTLPIELAQWNLSTITPGQNFTLCGTTPFVGGTGILKSNGNYSERIYTGLGSHSIIYFYVWFAPLDFWESQDYISFQFDSRQFNLVNMVRTYTLDFNLGACGVPGRYGVGAYIFGKVFHTGPDLALRIISNLDGPPSVKSFIFKNISLLFANNSGTVTEEICWISGPFLNGYHCPCGLGEYQSSGGSCQSCDPLCTHCFGPSPSECMKCASQTFFNGADCVQCHSSCFDCYGTTNQTCFSCNPPYTLVDNSCTGCSNSSDFVYWDHVCHSVCSYPLQNYTKNNVKFCELPLCEGGPCETCQTNDDCPAHHYCLPTPVVGVCQSYISYVLKPGLVKQILNGYLIRVEVSPLLGITEGSHDILYMDLENLQQDIEYTATINKVSKGIFMITVQMLKPREQASLLANFTYSPSGLGLTGNLNLPRLVFISPELQNAAKAVETGSYVTFGLLVLNTIGFIMTGGLSILWSFLPENQYSYYLLYLNIDYPYHTKVYLRSLANYNLVFSFDSDSSSSSSTADLQYNLPNRFVDEEYPPNFYQNTQMVIIITLSLTLILVFAILMTKYLDFLKRYPLIFKIFKTIKKIIRWNGILRQFLAYSLPTSLAAFIQVYISIFDFPVPIFSTILAITVFCFIMLFFIKTFFIIRQIPQTPFERIVYTEWYGTLWDDLCLNFNTRYYYWLLGIRGIVLMYFCVFFDILPFFQIIFPLLFQLYIISLYFKGRRFHQIFEVPSLTLVSFIEELLILITKITIVVYIFLQPYLEKDDQIIIIGWALIAPGFLNQILQTLYSIYSQIKNRKKLFDLFKKVWAKLFHRDSSRVKKIKRATSSQLSSTSRIPINHFTFNECPIDFPKNTNNIGEQNEPNEKMSIWRDHPDK